MLCSCSASGRHHAGRRLLEAALLSGAILGAAPWARGQDATDVVAREFTLLNDLSAPLNATPADASAREVTLLNDLSAALTAVPTDISAREMTLLNDLSAALTSPATEASSREATLFNDLSAILNAGPVDAITREFTVGEGTSPIGDVRTALSAAGGLLKLSAADLARLDVVAGASAGRVDLLDAVRLLRKATGLDP